MSQNHFQFLALSILFISISFGAAFILNITFGYNVIVIFSSFLTMITLVLGIYQILYVNVVVKQRFVTEDPELIGEILELMKKTAETEKEATKKLFEEFEEKSEEVNEKIDNINVKSDINYKKLEDESELMEERRKEFEEEMDLETEKPD